jgi:hypothetical protein
MCDANISKETAFTYLEDLKNSLYSSIPQREIDSARALMLNARFRDKLKGRMVLIKN